MTAGPERGHRRSIRLAGYDYSRPGAYFVTICTHQRACVLGRVEEGATVLSSTGSLVERCWRQLPRHFPDVELDAFVLMPNHLHGLIMLGAAQPILGGPWVSATRGEPPRGTRPGSLGAVVQNFKTVSTRKVNVLNGTAGAPLWQRDYYEHIVRDERALDTIRRYIEGNPSQWELDEENPAKLEAPVGHTPTSSPGRGAYTDIVPGRGEASRT